MLKCKSKLKCEKSYLDSSPPPGGKPSNSVLSSCDKTGTNPTLSLKSESSTISEKRKNAEIEKLNVKTKR